MGSQACSPQYYLSFEAAIHRNPRTDETPFILFDIHMVPNELYVEYGTTSTFKKTKTARESETDDHLSLRFGLGVGLPFLASVNSEAG